MNRHIHELQTVRPHLHSFPTLAKTLSAKECFRRYPVSRRSRTWAQIVMICRNSKPPVPGVDRTRDPGACTPMRTQWVICNLQHPKTLQCLHSGKRLPCNMFTAATEVHDGPIQSAAKNVQSQCSCLIEIKQPSCWESPIEALQLEILRRNGQLQWTHLFLRCREILSTWCVRCVALHSWLNRTIPSPPCPVVLLITADACAQAMASQYSLKWPNDRTMMIHILYIYILELTLIVGSAGLLDPRFPRRVGLKAIEYIEWGPASEIYSLFFFEHIHRIMELELCCYLRFFLGASGEGLFPQAPAKCVS